MKKISNPPTPYLGHIVGNFTDGKTVTIEGLVLPPAQRIVISFQTGQNPTHRDDIALHLSARLLEGTVARNSCIEGVWGAEETAGHYPLVVGKRFTIAVANERPKYIVTINGGSFEFRHRLPGSRVNHVSVQGDVKLYEISYETNPSHEDFVPLYDDPPPPYTQFAEPRRSRKGDDDDQCTMQMVLPALAVGAGVGAIGASLLGRRSNCQHRSCGDGCHCEKCRCALCRKKRGPPPRQEPQQESSSPWGSLGVGVATVGIIGAVGGILYSLTRGSGNDSDDD